MSAVQVPAPFMDFDGVSIHQGDARELLPRFESESFDCVTTSPPYYGHRSYGGGSTLGGEARVEDYVVALVAIFDELRRVLKPSGTCFLNIGESYDDKRALLVP